MSIRIIECPNGETCYAEECTQAGACMHENEAYPVSLFYESEAPMGPLDHFNEWNRRGGR